MKILFAALASASLIGATALPVAALAQSHHGSGGSFHGGGGYHPGGGFHGGPGFRGGYYHRYGGYPYVIGGLGLGLALGSAFASPWYYDYPAYYPGYYGYEVVEPAPPPYAYDAPPPAAGPRPPAACGAWKWDPSEDKYFWIPC